VRDVDLSGDGAVDNDDINLIRNRYNNVSTDSTFSSAYDIDTYIDVSNIVRLS